MQKFQLLKTEKSVFDLSEVINGMDVQNELVECNVDEYKWLIFGDGNGQYKNIIKQVFYDGKKIEDH